ncbi:hypothetical protein [Flavobacterium fluviatile]|uniref:hypothetical protein n=1 Tax=Flavobacterium fluviatile TaxID=1862387 RepID=UPI0013D460B0|nr:hypothetical protein [Flavobacterium fluviatile]
MKKIFLAFAILIGVANSYSQNVPANQQKKVSYFVKAATDEFDLNRSQQKKLLKAREDYINKYINLMQDYKKNAVSEEYKNTQQNELSKIFVQELTEISKRQPGEIQLFLDRMREELKNV